MEKLLIRMIRAHISGAYRAFAPMTLLMFAFALIYFITPIDLIHCRVYGNKNTNTLGGPAFGADSANTGNLAQAVPIIWEILRNHVGLAESKLDTAAFTSLQGSVADEIGIAIPPTSGNNFPAFKSKDQN